MLLHLLVLNNLACGNHLHKACLLVLLSFAPVKKPIGTLAAKPHLRSLILTITQSKWLLGRAQQVVRVHLFDYLESLRRLRQYFQGVEFLVSLLVNALLEFKFTRLKFCIFLFATTRC